jgi:hypothetical protein
MGEKILVVRCMKFEVQNKKCVVFRINAWHLSPGVIFSVTSLFRAIKSDLGKERFARVQLHLHYIDLPAQNRNLKDSIVG